MISTMASLEELQENPPSYAQETAELFRWSANYDHPTPAALFLDLIGFSAENLGEPLFDLNKVSERLGFMEPRMLGGALTEYANRPPEVMEYVEAYLAAEAAD